MSINANSTEIDSVLGWYGHAIIADSNFYNISKWTTNAQSGNYCTLNSSDTSIDMHWSIASGTGRWVQIYYRFDNPISLQNVDVFGFDVHGSPCQGSNCHSNVALEFKFENGSKQAVFERNGESGLLGINRWVERLFMLRNDNQFSISNGFNWDSITVFSIAVRSNPDYLTFDADSGTVSFRNVIGDSTGAWARAENPEILNIDVDTLNTIRKNAADFLAGRQKSTGLLTTWAEDNSSWLYGQGLALKALSLEGIWSDGVPQNDYATAAEKLAHFLADHQEPQGYWPRTWNSSTGEVINLYEAYDSSIWMGDFPWIITGLSSYYKKTCDTYVSGALNKACDFLKSLIADNGKFYTINVFNDRKIEVSSTEAIDAAIGALYEIGDTSDAVKLIQNIETNAWNGVLKYWNEATYSDRVVLYANTWTAQILMDKGYKENSLDALTFAGKLLFTRGPGSPYGLDGIGPIAVWYEGTLSYICAGGPGSNFLFNNIRPYINPDGSVPHYNDDIGGAGGIWAVKWSSLDGTSWLYNAASKSSPFKVLAPELNCPSAIKEPASANENSLILFPDPNVGLFNIKIPGPDGNFKIQIRSLDGKLLYNNIKSSSGHLISIDVTALAPGIYIVNAESRSWIVSRRFIHF